MRHLWKSGLVLALGACAPRSAPGTNPAGPEIPVLVVNESSDMMRVQAEGATTLRLAPNQRGCLRLRTSSTNVVLQAVPVGGIPDNPGVGQGTSRSGTQRSRAFNPMDARGWEWHVDQNPTTANTSLRPADSPCG